MSIPNNDFDNIDLVSAYGEVMKEVLTLAKDADFRDFIFRSAQTSNKNDDDYVISLDKATKTLKSSQKHTKSALILESLISKIKNLNNKYEPIVFFPKAETIEDNILTNKSYDIAKNLKEPIVVLRGAYNKDYSVPGYKLSANGELIFERMVTEEYAWENDVYVIGAAEDTLEKINLDSDKQNKDFEVTWGENSKANFISRINGRQELGGRIQVVSNLNEIEHWLSGKLEFRLIISGVQGGAGTVIRDIPFPKVKRKHFKDKKWYDYNVFLFNWNLSNLGDYNVEKWMERDGGSNTEVSISIPGSAFKPATSTTPAQPAFPGTTVKVSSKRDDDDLGSSIVQFSDNITQIYPLGKINIRRK